MAACVPQENPFEFFMLYIMFSKQTVNVAKADKITKLITDL
jgi:hypothetical protein